MVLPFGPRGRLRLLLEARRELVLRVPPIAVTAADALDHERRRAEWTEPTAASRLAELMRVEDDELWSRLRAASEEEQRAVVDAWVRGDEAATVLAIDRFLD